MGDRALVTFKSGDDYSPVVYLHWNGSEVEEWLRQAAPGLRKGDPTYASARFCGFCHEATGKRTTGLGLLPPFDDDERKDLAKASHGDAGVLVVDVDSGRVTTFGGYVKAFTIDPKTFGE